MKGGHEIILHAFDNFKDVCSETQRFQTLMAYFMNYECFHIEFMVSHHPISLKYHEQIKLIGKVCLHGIGKQLGKM